MNIINIKIKNNFVSDLLMKTNNEFNCISSQRKYKYLKLITKKFQAMRIIFYNK